VFFFFCYTTDDAHTLPSMDLTFDNLDALTKLHSESAALETVVWLLGDGEEEKADEARSSINTHKPHHTHPYSANVKIIPAFARAWTPYTYYNSDSSSSSSSEYDSDSTAEQEESNDEEEEEDTDISQPAFHERGGCVYYSRAAMSIQ
jgi:hypothetical protein